MNLERQICNAHQPAGRERSRRQQKMLPVTTVGATHSQLTKRLGLPSRALHRTAAPRMRSMQELSSEQTLTRLALREEDIIVSASAGAPPR